MDTVNARGTFDLGSLGSIAFEDQYYVLTATREQVEDGERTLTAPFDAVFGLDGTANVYDLNDLILIPSTGQLAFGDSGFVRKIITDQAGSFEDFAIYQSPAPDPVDGVLLDSTAGANSGNVGAPWQRQWISFLPSKRASFTALGMRFKSMPSSSRQFIDAAQIEINPDGDGPSPYASARQVQALVRPTRLNYSVNPSLANSAANWGGGTRTQFGSEWSYVGTGPVTHTFSGLLVGREYVASVRVIDQVQMSDLVPTVAGAETVSDGWLDDRRWVRFIATASTLTLTLTPTANGSPSYRVDRALVEQGTAPRQYFDGDSGDDYLWEQGGTPGEVRSYFYEDRDERHYILERTLRENVPVGVSVSDPEYATGPPTS